MRPASCLSRAAAAATRQSLTSWRALACNGIQDSRTHFPRLSAAGLAIPGVPTAVRGQRHGMPQRSTAPARGQCNWGVGGYIPRLKLSSGVSELGGRQRGVASEAEGGGGDVDVRMVEEEYLEGRKKARCEGIPRIRIRCLVEYDGTNYSGFQSQGPKGEQLIGHTGIPVTIPATVQGEIEEAILKLEGHVGPPPREFRVLCAGRTDKGTHASGQVISFDLAWRHSPEKLTKAINHHLPLDIAIRDARVVSDEFHPRFGASFRQYKFRYYTAPIRAWHIPEPLDVVAMQQALDHLVGSHDFITFGSAPDEGGHTVRELMFAQVQRESPTIISFDIQGRSFLYKMVRNIAATLRLVGNGTITPDDVKEMLEARDRARSPKAAPARGLTLTEVGFWGEDGGKSYEAWLEERPEEVDFSPRLEKDTYGKPRAPGSSPPTS